MKNLFIRKTRKKNTIKPPILGIGERSKVNGLYKTKLVSRHIRRTSKGIRNVSSYKRSK